MPFWERLADLSPVSSTFINIVDVLLVWFVIYQTTYDY